MVLDIVHDDVFFRYDEIICKKKTTNKEIKEIFIADSGYTSHMVNSLKNMSNIREVKTAVKIGNEKTMTVRVGVCLGFVKG